MTKAQPKPILNLYLFESDQDSSNFNQAIFSRLISQEDPRFELSVYLDFTRHNGLYEYKNYSLPLWAHVTVKKKMKPAEALAVINFSMLPILACYRNQDWLIVSRSLHIHITINLNPPSHTSSSSCFVPLSGRWTQHPHRPMTEMCCPCWSGTYPTGRSCLPVTKLHLCQERCCSSSISWTGYQESFDRRFPFTWD